MGYLEINRNPIRPVARLFENHVAKSANKRKIAKVCDRTMWPAPRVQRVPMALIATSPAQRVPMVQTCLLCPSDAADVLTRVDT